MTSRIRVVAAIKREEPDFIPVGENQIDGEVIQALLNKNTLCNTGWEELNALWTGRRAEIVKDYCETLVELVNTMELDYIRVPTVPADRAYALPKITGRYSWMDDKGDEFQLNPQAGNYVVRAHYHALSTSDLPDPNANYEVDDSELEVIRHVVRELGGTHFLIAKLPVDGTFPWEHTVGMEEFLVRMITDPEFVSRAIQAYVNRSIKYMEAIIPLGVDAVMTVDDYCDNKGPIMGLELFRRFILPGIRRQVEVAHELGAYFIKHTDGFLWEILDDLASAGIDGLHGLQRNIGMDFRELKKQYGSKFCLFGGVNFETLVTGSTQEVREEVRTAIEAAGKGGGLVITNSNVVGAGTNVDNYLAMRQAAREFGKYR